MMTRTLRSLPKLFVVALLASCSGSECVSGPLCNDGGGGGGGGTVTVTLSAANTTLNAIGASVQVTANVANSTATPAWASSDAAIARVSASGLVTAVSNGSATITATVAGVSGTVSITVAQTVSTVVITPNNLQFTAVGQTSQLAADPQDANGNTVASANVAWAHEDGAIATVSATGLVTAEGNGTTVVTATAAGVSAGIGVSVTFDDILPTVVSISPTNDAFAIALGRVITVEMSEDIDPAGVDHVTLTGPSGQVSATILISGSTITVTPDASLQGVSSYIVTVTQSTQDLAGNPIAAPVQSLFWTDVDPTRWYRLTNEFRGPGFSLDSPALECVMAPTTDITGQYWRFQPVGNGTYHMRSLYLGDPRQLEGLDGINPCRMDPSGPFTGHNWFLVPDGRGYFRLHTQSYDLTRALDDVSMVATGNFTGQFWLLEDLGLVTESAAIPPSFSFTTASPSLNFTEDVDHPYLNASPAALPIVTQNFEPADVVNPNPVGVFYTGTGWAVFNENLGTMPSGASFNVLSARDVGVDAYTHTEVTGGLVRTELDHPSINNDPNALVFITQNWNPLGVGGVYNPAPVGVEYDISSPGRWSIYNIDFSVMPAGAAFNVMVGNLNSNAFAHVATLTNDNGGGATILDHPILNGNPDARIMVTQNYSAPGAGVDNPAPIGVFYDGSQWLIFNQDLSAIVPGAGFNVIIEDGFAPYWN